MVDGYVDLYRQALLSETPIAAAISKASDFNFDAQALQSNGHNSKQKAI
jgi:hypothetical protein